MQELVIEFQNVNKSYLNKKVLVIDHLAVYANDRIGIIGGNGQGKSTLLDLMSETISPDQGAVHKLIEFHYYRQIEEIESKDTDHLDPIWAEKFQLPHHDIAGFSGGQEARLRLSALLSDYRPGLLLDEPTTHLDAEGIRLLTEELKSYYGTLLVVSHDRSFLDQVAEKIWEVEDGKVTEYPGNYTDYLAQKEQELLTQERAYEAFVKERNRLEKSAAEKHAQAQRLGKVSAKQKKRRIKPSRLSSSKQKDTVQKAAHKASKAIEKRLEQLEHAEPVKQTQMLRFPASEQLKLHHPFPVMGEDVTIRKGSTFLLENARFQFPLGKRVGIIGPNGSGKSSLLQHILTKGEGIILSPKAVFSVYNQMDYKQVADKNLLDYLAQDSDYPEPFLRAVLNNLGFDQIQIMRPVKNLSGGEVTRLAIANLFTKPSNILVLDEPTNFIDIETIEALEKLMFGYRGTILFTSHDHRFLERMSEQIWEIMDRKLRLKKDK